MNVFKPATRENVGLLIGLAGGTGSGKTMTALRLATGMAGGKPFALIDTENRRSLHYADSFRFDVAELKAPFSPDAYAGAIMAADKAGYPVIVVDSATHEWAGSGGVLDMQEAELNRMAGDDWKKREACKMAAWIKPKMQHKSMVSKLLQVRAHVILCFRAEEKIEMVRDDKGKMQIVAKQTLTGLDGWVPVCEKNLPFELTVSFLLTAAKPGIPLPIKLQEQHKPLFPPGRLIDESCGARLAEWARGGVAPASRETIDAPVKPHTDQSPARPKETAPTAERARAVAFYNGYLAKLESATVMAALVQLIKNNVDGREFLLNHAPDLYAKTQLAEQTARDRITQADAEFSMDQHDVLLEQKPHE